MRPDWDFRALSDVCQIKPPKKEARQKLSNEESVSFVPMDQLGIREKDLHLTQNKQLQEVAGSYTYFAEGDVLLAKITPCFENGKLGIARGLTNGIGFGSSEFIVFRPNEELNPEYLFYFLSQDSFRDAGARVMSGAVGHKRVPKEFIENHLIPIPSTDEQKRIVAILDEAFAGIETAIANTEKNLANACELFESYLNSVFTRKGDGWEDVAIGDIAQVKGGKRVPKGYKLQTEPTKHPYISVSDFNDTGSVDLEKIKFISEDVYQQISRYTISSKDLYISIAGTIGKSGIIPKELEGANLTENACKLVLDTGVSNRYLYFFTRTESFKEQALKNTRTAAQPKLALERLKTIRLSLPPLEIQEKLIGQFNELWRQTQDLELIYKQKLTALAELKQSLLQKAFSGELTAETEKEVEEAVA